MIYTTMDAGLARTVMQAGEGVAIDDQQRWDLTELAKWLSERHIIDPESLDAIPGDMELDDKYDEGFTAGQGESQE